MAYDLIIVGAGFAGLSLAHRLPQNFRILLLDEKKKIDTPVKSTGLIRPRTRALFEEILPIHAYLSHSIRHLGVSDPSLDKVFFSSAEEPWLYATETTELVQRLTDTLPKNVDLALGHRFKAVEYGLGDFPVEVEHSEGKDIYKTKARFLVGSDGAASMVARSNVRLPKNKVFLAGMESILAGEIIKGPSPVSTVFHLWLGKFCLGYGAWISPARYFGKTAIKIGLASHKNQSTQLLAKLRELIPLLEEKKLICLHEKDPLFTFGNLIPIGGALKPVFDRHTLLLGDSAGLCGPFAADGIQGALLSSKLAAEYIPSYLAGQKEVFKQFHSSLEKEYHFLSYLKRERRHRKIWDLFRSDRSFELLYDLVSRESEHLVQRFSESQSRRKSLIRMVLKPRHFGRLLRLGFLLLKDRFKKNP